MPEFTPGPWEILDENTVYAEHAGHYIVPPDDMRPDAPTAADARLIVAAPEMYEWIDRVCNLEALSFDGQEDWVIAGRALLAQITGETKE